MLLEAEETKFLLYDFNGLLAACCHATRWPNELDRHDGQTQSVARDNMTVFMEMAGWHVKVRVALNGGV